MTTHTDYAVPTGEYIAEWLDENDMSQAELARRMGVSPKHVSKLLSGAALTSDVALSLSLVTGISERIWLTYEATYRADVARLSMTAELAGAKALAQQFPLSHLRGCGRLTGTLRRPGELLMELLAFFEVGSLDALKQAIERRAVAYRHSTAHDIDEYALATWLRLAELEAHLHLADLPAYDASLLEQRLPSVRSLSVDPSADFGDRLVSLLAETGVLLLFIPEVKGARMYGATRWVGETPVIALTARGRNDGQFWFTLFHEVGHVLLHHDRRTHIRPAGADARLDPTETEADAFARVTLIPEAASSELPALKSKSDVRAFASRIGVSPGVVVGRLWHERLWDFKDGHELCLKLSIVDDDEPRS